MAEVELGEQLRRARGAVGLSQEEVAQRVGVTRVTVSDWERGAAIPREENIAALAKLYGTTVRDLRAASSGSAPSLPQRVRVWLAEFQAELTRANATDEEIEEAMELLRSPQVRTFFVSGAPREMSEDQTIEGMEAIATVVRATLRKRGRKVAR